MGLRVKNLNLQVKQFRQEVNQDRNRTAKMVERTQVVKEAQNTMFRMIVKLLNNLALSASSEMKINKSL